MARVLFHGGSFQRRSPRRRSASSWRAFVAVVVWVLALGAMACESPESYRGGLEPGVDGDAGPTPDGGASPDAPDDGDGGSGSDASLVAPTCANGFKDGRETDVDCGGTDCRACAAARTCASNRDCSSAACLDGFCAAVASCQNGSTDGEETDRDCGGPQCAGCGEGRACDTPSDCVSRSCNGVCQAPSCTDGIRNGSETDTDCGGGCLARCAERQGCQRDDDCASGTCAQGLCTKEPVCTDGVQNGMETDKDCGGSACAACSAGKTCKVASDCLSLVCKAGLCDSVVSCTNGTRDGAETDVDCGGTDCVPCPSARMCRSNGDCVSGSCDEGLCLALDLRVQQRSWEVAPVTRDIKFQFQIINNGPAPPPALTDLKVRYWFSDDGNVGPYAFVSDWALITAAFVRGKVVRLPDSPNPTANAYLEISFSGGAFAATVPNTQQSNTGIIQARFHGTSFPSFTETNDYSFEPNNPSFTDEPKLTLYLNEILVWGQEPW